MNPSIFIYYLILLLLTFAGGSFPIFKKNWKGKYLGLLLVFSAAFLLGITFLHLIPDAVENLGVYSGVLMFCGFFVQQIVQRWTHGVEHGHDSINHHHHHHEHEGNAVFWPVFWGLSIHAFSEGLPLGIHYADPHTLPSLALAIALHKIPEAMLVMALYLAKGKSKMSSIFLLLLFSLITPFSALVSLILGNYFTTVGIILQWCIPVIAGVFIQIATTIFYESSSHSHFLKWQKWLVVVAGAGVAMLSLL
jgi:zinc transporter ZupT